MTTPQVQVRLPRDGRLFASAMLPPLADAYGVALPASLVSVRECDGADAPVADGGVRVGKLYGDLAAARCVAHALMHVAPRLLGTLCGATVFERAEHEHWLGTLGALAGDASALATFAPQLDAHLATRSFVVGYEPTLADLYCFAVVRDRRGGVPADRLKKLRATHRHFSRWLRFVENLPYVAAAVERASEAASSAVGGWDQVARLVGMAGSYEVALPNAEYGRVVTRFPPEPSGYLHIGHTKALLLNDYFARVYGGKLILRFDDTNPSKESSEYEESILADCHALGVAPDVAEYTSDYFAQLLEWCTKFIRDGSAYVDSTPVGQMREQRLRCESSACRERSVDENLRLWRAMRDGAEEARGCCVRAKIDMQAKNTAMRDPVIYRAVGGAAATAAPGDDGGGGDDGNRNATGAGGAAAATDQSGTLQHHRTGGEYLVYPSYDFACPIVDSLEGVTHALRTSEYQDREAQYYWMCEAAGVRRPTIWTYSRLNFVRTVLSKRMLTWMVGHGVVDGWDDPRMPTVRGVLRRGMQVDALRAFILSQGPSKNITVQSWDKLWSTNKRLVDQTAPRFTAISASAYCILLVDDLDSVGGDRAPGTENGVGAAAGAMAVAPSTSAATDGALRYHVVKEVLLHKKNPDLGSKLLLLGRRAMLEADDAATFTAGERVTLMDLGNVRIDKVHTDDDGFDNGSGTEGGGASGGNGVKIEAAAAPLPRRQVARCTFLPHDTDFKRTKKVTWLACVPDLVPVELVAYDHLLRKDKLDDENDDIAEWVNSNDASKSVERALADVNVRAVAHGSVIQFERRGFFRCDRAYVRGNEPMRFVEIPDGRNAGR